MLSYFWKEGRRGVRASLRNPLTLVAGLGVAAALVGVEERVRDEQGGAGGERGIHADGSHLGISRESQVELDLVVPKKGKKNES